MCLLPDGVILLSVPNFNDPSQRPLIMKITPDNHAEPFLELPDNPQTGKPFGPMGICVGPNGDLFLADNQRGETRKSRVCRIKMENGLPVEIGPVIEGFNVANAVLCHGEYLFVTDTQIDAERYPALSGVFRFRLKDLEEGVIVLADELRHDPHLIAVLETYDKTMPLGADGLCVDHEGNLYVGNVYDGTVHRIRFDAEGKPAANELFAKSEVMKSADGLFFDTQRKVIYVADPRANAVQVVHLDGRVETLAQNGDTDGRDGSLDMPVEVLVRGNQLIVSNMDWPLAGCLNSRFDPPATLSVIDLD
jgi:sugar lactone lactonase YvrE